MHVNPRKATPGGGLPPVKYRRRRTDYNLIRIETSCIRQTHYEWARMRIPRGILGRSSASRRSDSGGSRADARNFGEYISRSQSIRDSASGLLDAHKSAEMLSRVQTNPEQRELCGTAITVRPLPIADTKTITVHGIAFGLFASTPTVARAAARRRIIC